MMKHMYDPFTAKGMVKLHARLVSLYPNLDVELVQQSDKSPKLMLGYSIIDVEQLLILLKAKQIELQPVIDDVNQFIKLLER